MQKADRKKLLGKKAKAFINQQPHAYVSFDPFSLPECGGVYYISLKKNSGEIPLFIDFTDNLRKELIVKQVLHNKAIERNTILWIDDKPEIMQPEQTLEYLNKHLFIRYLLEPDTKEQMALMVNAVLLLKPLYVGN
jgi:hypothetical protein